MQQFTFPHQIRILLIALFGYVALSATSFAQYVDVAYESTDGMVSVSPFTIPNPDTGIDITITPTLAIDQGSFVARFASTGNEEIVDGYASVSDLMFAGSADIELASSIEVFGFPVAATATLSGPISASQIQPSVGRLDGNAFIESSAGAFDVTFGPLECTDSAFGVFCAAIQTGLGVPLPIPAIVTSATPLPIAIGEFSNLQTRGGSTVSSQVMLSVPLGEDNMLGADVEFTWVESGREFVVPEPAMSPCLLACVVLLGMRRYLSWGG